MGFPEPDDVRVAHAQARPCFALEELDGGGICLPFFAEHLDCAGRVAGTIPRGEDTSKRSAAERVKEFVPGNLWRFGHRTGLDTTGRLGRAGKAACGGIIGWGGRGNAVKGLRRRGRMAKHESATDEPVGVLRAERSWWQVIFQQCLQVAVVARWTFSDRQDVYSSVGLGNRITRLASGPAARGQEGS